MADPSPALRLLFKARSVLGLNQREFADAVDSSVRTVARWEANQSGPRPDQLHNAARLVHSVDPALA